MTTLPNRPIVLVTFDLYDTLVEADPPRWERFARALERAGMPVPVERVLHADRRAEDHYTIENGRYPIRDRTPEEVQRFRLDQTRAYLEALALPTDDATVRRVQRHFVDETSSGGWRYRVFEDVEPALLSLAGAGVKRAIISNADADVTEFCLSMGFAHHMDVIVTSALVGWEKPDARTFFAALDPLGVTPADALHIGDQPLSDIKGARAIGMATALIDRYGRHRDGEHPAIRVRSLLELAELVIAHNDRLGAAVG